MKLFEYKHYAIQSKWYMGYVVERPDIMRALYVIMPFNIICIFFLWIWTWFKWRYAISRRELLEEMQKDLIRSGKVERQIEDIETRFYG